MGLCASSDNGEVDQLGDDEIAEGKGGKKGKKGPPKPEKTPEERAKELEEAAAQADELPDSKPHGNTVIQQKRQAIKAAFKEVMRRERTKPPFDPDMPEAHLKKKGDADSEEGDEEDENDEEEEEPVPAPAKPPQGSDESSDEESDEEGGEGSEGDQEGPPPLPPVPKMMPDLWDVIELCGNVEVWEDVRELAGLGLDDIDELLGRADEGADSDYPWCQAHFLAVCRATLKVDEDASKPSDWPSGVPFPYEYPAAVVGMRQSFSNLSRCPDKIRPALAMDVAKLYFDEDADKDSLGRIGIDFDIDKGAETAEVKLASMTAMGFKKVMDRLEFVLVKEIIHAYFDAYREVGDKESLVYPEEDEIIKANYPEKEDDDDSDEAATNQLDVLIEKAEDLPGLNDDDTSDPMIKITLGDESFYSGVRRQTCNPIWGKEGGYFKFMVDPEEYSSQKLVIGIYDDDPDGEQFIGERKLDLSKMVKKNGPWVSENLTLCNESGHEDKRNGTVFVQLRYGPVRADNEGAGPAADYIYAPKLCRKEYPFASKAIHKAATQISSARRIYLAGGDLRNKKAHLAAGENAENNAASKIQRTWRNQRAMKILKDFRKRMLGGGYFFKYSTKGIREERHVYCDDNLRTIYWKKSGVAGSISGAGEMPVSSVKAVLLGRMTNNFKQFDLQPGKPQQVDPVLVNASFSIVGADRTLDLQCKKGDKRSDWLSAFALLLSDQISSADLLMMRKAAAT